MTIHQGTFEEATAPVVKAIEAPPLAQLELEHKAAALQGIRFYKFSARRAAKAEADASAALAHGQAVFEASAATQQRQVEADRWWQQVHENETGTVLALLEDAFEDNEVPAAAVGISGSEAALVVLVPALDVVPERTPSLTSAGNLSLKKMTKTERVGIYNEFVAGCLLVTLKEAFAVAPGIQSACVAALRDDGRDAYGQADLVCLMAGRWARRSLDRVVWTTDASRILNDTSTEILLSQKGQTKELRPLDLSNEPDINKLLSATDFG